MPRVVSLIASATEIVCALGCRNMLVGRSHECDHPPDVTVLPVLSEPAIDVQGTSAEIDRRVRQAVAGDGLSVYRVAGDRLRALAPDVIVTQDHCKVCAVSLADVERATCELVGKDVRVVSLKPDRLAALWVGIREVAAALGVEAAGEALVARLQERMAEVEALAARAVELRGRRPRVAVIEWIDPVMVAGNWLPELVAMAGGEDVLGEAGHHSPAIPFEELVAAAPDVIVIAPCGFEIERTIDELPILAERPDWPSLQAVREGRVVVADGNRYMTRPGPRLVETLEILAEVIHPADLHFGHEGNGWVRRGWSGDRDCR